MHIDDVEIVVTNVDFIMGYPEGWDKVPGIDAATAEALNQMGQDVAKCEAFLNSLNRGYAYRIVEKDSVKQEFDITRKNTAGTNEFESGIKVVSIIEKRLKSTIANIQKPQVPTQ